MKVIEAKVNTKTLPAKCELCRFWRHFSCLLKPELICRSGRSARSIGCPLVESEEE